MLKESTQLDRVNVHISGQSINFDILLIQFLNFFKNQPSVFNARMNRITSNLAMRYSHSSMSFTLIENIKLIEKKKYCLVDSIHQELRCL